MTRDDPKDLASENERLRRELAQVRGELDRRASQVQELASELEKKERELLRLQAAHDKLARQLFGQKAERIDPQQLRLAFAVEPGEGASEDAPPHVDEAPDEETPAPPRGRERKKRQSGRTRLPADLPRERREYYPSLEERTCDCCGGEKRPMGEELTEQLEYDPARFRLIEHARVKYSCARCQSGVVCPPLPPFPIEKGRPGPGLLAEVIVNKYGDHLPLNRQEEIFARHGVRIPKTTLCEWIAQSAHLLEPIANAVARQVLSRPVVQIDETGVLVLDPGEPKGRRKGRIWVLGGAQGELWYAYSPTKETVQVERLLEGFQGYLQADAYPGFDRIYASGEVIEVGCHSHLRRYFFEAFDSSPKEASWAMAAIGELFKIEREAKAKGLSPEERLALRRERSEPIVTSFYEWLDQLAPTVLPRSPLADALRYAQNHRQAMCRFLEDGRLELDNNRSERALRKVACGRNNWLFAGSAMGAHRAAVLYTLVQSSRELGLSPFEYLRDVIERVSTHPARLIEELTPRGWKAAREAATQAQATELAATV